MHLLDQERNVVDGQPPSEMVPDGRDAENAGEVADADVLAVRVGRPHAQARRRGVVEEAELAVEEEVCEARS